MGEMGGVPHASRERALRIPHPLQFFLNNCIQREQALGQAQIFLKSSDVPTDTDTLKSLLSVPGGDGGSDVTRKMEIMSDLTKKCMYFGGNVRDSDAYWYNPKLNLNAIIEHLYREERKRALVFLSGFCAEYHDFFYKRFAMKGHFAPSRS